MHTMTTLRALAKRCGEGSEPNDVEAYARADLLKLFQERTEIARIFECDEERISRALEKLEIDGRIHEIGSALLTTIKIRLEKAKKAKAAASIGLTEAAARAFLASPSLTTLRALCDAGDFGVGGFAFQRKTIGAIVRRIKDADVWIDRAKGFSIVVQAPKLRYRFIASFERAPGFDLDTI